MTVAEVLECPVSITSLSTEQHERETPQFTRVTTEIALSGDGKTGRGEDVTYEADAHDDLADAGLPDLTGKYTLAEFSEAGRRYPPVSLAAGTTGLPTLPAVGDRIGRPRSCVATAGDRSRHAA